MLNFLTLLRLIKIQTKIDFVSEKGLSLRRVITLFDIQDTEEERHG
jgi:hypothetical protein